MSRPEKSRSAEAAASPSQNNNSNDEEAPPSYSGPHSPSQSSQDLAPPPSQRLSQTPGIVQLDFAGYLPTNSTISKDHVVVTVTTPSLLTDHIALAKFITAQVALPPRPQIRIQGSHNSHGGARVLDFDLRLNMQRYILRPQGSSQWNYVSINSINNNNTSIAAWATKFCKDKTENKSFIIQREVSNWNISLLDGRLRSLLASLNYRGRIAITFPTTHATVIVQPQATLYSRLVSLMRETTKYEAIRSIWPYADVADGQQEANSGVRNCVIQSEEAWFKDWQSTIARAAVEARKGWVTLDDLMEDAVLPILSAPNVEWGVDR